MADLPFYASVCGSRTEAEAVRLSAPGPGLVLVEVDQGELDS